eukprot:8687289-Alexandrium_andersonii.AAC.1
MISPACRQRHASCNASAGHVISGGGRRAATDAHAALGQGFRHSQPGAESALKRLKRHNAANTPTHA